MAESSVTNTAKECPNKANHTPCPEGYIAWHDWSLKKSKRHYQIRCPDCGLFAIWKRRPRGQANYGGDEYLIEMAK